MNTEETLREALRLLAGDRQRWISGVTSTEPSENSFKARELLEKAVDSFSKDSADPICKELYSTPDLDSMRKAVRGEISTYGPSDRRTWMLHVIDEVQTARHWIERFYSFLKLYFKEDGEEGCKCDVCEKGRKLEKDFIKRCGEGREREEKEWLRTLKRKDKVIVDLRRTVSSIGHECEQAEMRTMVGLGELLPQTTDRPNKEANDSSQSEDLCQSSK